MNENLPVHVNEIQNDGVITYANEVIAIIAGMAVNEVDGVASMINTNAIADLFNRGKPITRGVKVEVGVEEASVDLVLTVEYGKPIQKVCVDVQEGVRKAIESMTGLHVVKVDVHVMGVSFERETKEIAQGYVKATTAQKAIEETKAPVPPTEPVAPAATTEPAIKSREPAKEKESADDGKDADELKSEEDFFFDAMDEMSEITGADEGSVEETDDETNDPVVWNAFDHGGSSALDEESNNSFEEEAE